jgi:toxin-antitoxin system PIN domain toxin
LTVVDANILLYAYNADAPQHAPTAAWLTELFHSGEQVGIPWLAIWAFTRIATNQRVWPRPKSAQEVFALVENWLSQPNVIVLNPGPRHAAILQRLIATYRTTGPLVTDAVFAALAIECGATLASTDQDFRRFPEVRWIHPLASKS